MASAIEICNFSLSHLGVGKLIASLNEQSQEARACNLFYESTRDAVLRDAMWPFARRIQSLGLVEEDPNSEWSYSYRYPTNCLYFRRILSGSRNDSRQSRVPYRFAYADDGQLVLTDKEDAEAEWTVKVTNPARYSEDFALALSLRLAGYVAPRLTGGDPHKLGQRALQLYEAEISKARASAFNEEQADEEVDAEFIRARD